LNCLVAATTSHQPEFEEVIAAHQEAPPLPAPPPPPPEEEYPLAPPPPPPPETDDATLGQELDSFYSEMAGIEASQEKKDEETPQAQEQEAVKDEPTEPVEMVNKNRKVCRLI
jgi:hypothetical protein